MTATVKTGDVFVSSWGYDQTNVDFYEIVRVSATGKTAKARQVKSVVMADQGPSERVVAATGADRFVEDARCARCSNHHRNADGKTDNTATGWNGHAYTDEYGWSAKTNQVTVESWQHAYRWDGETRHQTAAGYGH
jgi:hypothetical protein